jgi:peptidoglycan hydrolase-like protein with peptidoglycan-binding domain
MTYHLAPSLAQLRLEVNMRWPNRSKSSDGWIGDPAHKERRSDHNPNERGSVNALDVTADGIVPAELVAAAIRHPSTAYVIHDGFIWSRTYGWAKRPYGGSNPHHTHVHISIQQTVAAEQNTSKWFVKNRSTWPLGPGEVFGSKKSARVRNGTESPMHADAVRKIQARLRIGTTGRYGVVTMVKVANWQTWKKIKPTGTVGPVTWQKMGL